MALRGKKCVFGGVGGLRKSGVFKCTWLMQCMYVSASYMTIHIHHHVWLRFALKMECTVMLRNEEKVGMGKETMIRWQRNFLNFSLPNISNI